ncbi:profilin-2 [Piptocephalis cylindrospora]|uniref:Profilin n=1 Tax=Piptocephalis cylindrospora TaxID=1907219 RepID=A0A4P9Y8G1_9FUNG|nr:profilin-2 [Piptocephalis cylindrospora]|eukprot:RKP15363.1 profilin-2 [Piptocephalis cylindrospora]
MSWQTYVDTNLVGSRKVAQAAIFGQDKSQWAASPNFTLSNAELAEIASGFTDASPLREKGLHAAGTKYLLLRADERSLYGKQGSSGIVCVKTVTAIIVAVYGEGIQPGEATTTVEGLADYLINAGFEERGRNLRECVCP